MGECQNNRRPERGDPGGGDHAVPDELADFYGLQAMAVRGMVESGESFARLRVPPEASSIPLHIELLDREQVPLDLHREIGGGARIRAGIEFDAAGRRVAYRVLSSRPGDPLPETPGLVSVP